MFGWLKKDKVVPEVVEEIQETKEEKEAREIKENEEYLLNNNYVEGITWEFVSDSPLLTKDFSVTFLTYKIEIGPIYDRKEVIHNLTGPAVFYGSGKVEYYIMGMQVSEAFVNSIKKNKEAIQELEKKALEIARQYYPDAQIDKEREQFDWTRTKEIKQQRVLEIDKN
jgi:hypothetical protein